MQIPFNRPYLTGNELLYIKDAIDSAVRGGAYLWRWPIHALLRNSWSHVLVQKVLLTTSGTSALELASFLLDLKPGDEVIVPSIPSLQP